MITSGSLNGVIAVSHCNRLCYAYDVLSEALERVILALFLAEKRQELPTKLQEVTSDPLSYSDTAFQNSEEFLRSYGDYFQSTLNRDNGKTTQFLARYLEMMRMQTMMYAAVQENNFMMQLQA